MTFSAYVYGKFSLVYINLLMKWSQVHQQFLRGLDAKLILNSLISGAQSCNESIFSEEAENSFFYSILSGIKNRVFPHHSFPDFYFNNKKALKTQRKRFFFL